MYSGVAPPIAGVGPKAGTQRVVNRLTLALHASVALVALSIAFVLFDNSLFAWHPAFMSIGYIVFMTEGLIAAIHFRHIDGPDRVKAIWSHALLQIRALVCVLIGFGVIYRNKILLGKPHFMSLHAKFGLATLILSVLMPLWGLVSFRRMGIIQKFPERWQPRIKALHRQLGLLTWLLALVTIELALPHPAVAKGRLTQAWQAGVALIGVLLLGLSLKAVVTPKSLGGAEDPLSKTV
ncbi:hypothetical protein CHLRE_06g280100v5 [Chlamydomonas reinhardtii]|uniref:Uncharacterized protein n=1 Tax=Chlamydomonas reinhardtii TaxID=3055 RepID=A8J1Z7_CHLRE|nr:uncharacterized protein CHLRE_06g280100v5 [Chlamydomonas reinhardtii]PNW82466.1 hypothetical protein CHLRE_06g280100v5 [Chlamydomonas reinhardtii]|eukprot:XP_001695310.1 cytochrome b-561-like protein [Chlamydomonas reinhardtii]